MAEFTFIESACDADSGYIFHPECYWGTEPALLIFFGFSIIVFFGTLGVAEWIQRLAERRGPAHFLKVLTDTYPRRKTWKWSGRRWRSYTRYG